ncbi:hypothetical protein BDN70DRAFT_888090 [Pholiota conissans]|uniref:Uncharacterized protein n=1 Tax=Pholiota conissans TaxID=109636 RepID=A0A9P5YMW5_9AGAR|nr:hypothetical protein BDN70DRAFT_888090 [Pholiota conissans]
MASCHYNYAQFLTGSEPSQEIDPQLISRFEGILQAKLFEMEEGYCPKSRTLKL